MARPKIPGGLGPQGRAASAWIRIARKQTARQYTQLARVPPAARSGHKFLGAALAAAAIGGGYASYRARQRRAAARAQAVTGRGRAG
jgi:hypothetical protein